MSKLLAGGNTKEEAKQIFCALLDGRDIELYDSEYLEWIDLPKSNTDLYFAKVKYRIKQEPEHPKYVPFTFEDRGLFRGAWIKCKATGHEMAILQCFGEGISTIEGEYSYKDAFKHVTFLDGSPFGKLEEKNPEKF